MKTEEILRREAEYRVIREAFGTYHVDLVAPGGAQAQDPAANTAGIAGLAIRQPNQAGEASRCPDSPTCSAPEAGWDGQRPAARSPD